MRRQRRFVLSKPGVSLPLKLSKSVSPVNELARFRIVLEEEASEFVICQSGRKQRKLLDIAYAIARSPLPSPTIFCRTVTAVLLHMSPLKGSCSVIGSMPRSNE